MNPFTARAMIKDPDAFVGRRVALEQLYTLIQAMQNCSIVGPRRIGKSSLLYYLTQPAVYPAHLSEAQDYVLAFIDLQELAGLEPSDFFFTAVERLCKSSGGRLQADPEKYGTLSGFRRFLMRATDMGLKLVLCCDEFEMLSQNANFGVDFFTYLRGISSNYALTLITSSRSSLYELCHSGNLQTSQFWNVFIEQRLGLMTKAEAREAIRVPMSGSAITMTREDERYLLKLAGYHPFYIQVAGYYLYAEKIRTANPDYREVALRFIDEAYRYYRHAWEQLTAREQSVLLQLLKGEQTSVDLTVFRQLHHQALINGSPEQPAFVSLGWQYFMKKLPRESMAQPAANSGPPVPPTHSLGIPPQLYARLQRVLFACGVFESERALKSVFVDARIIAWRDALPQAESASQRAQFVIDFLYDKYDTQQQNALMLFLRVLSDRISQVDVRHQQLLDLMSKLGILIMGS